MNSRFYLIPGKNSRSLYHTFYHTTKRVRVAEDGFKEEWPVVAMNDTSWFLVHNDAVVEVELKFHKHRWYIIPAWRVSYHNVEDWEYGDVSDLDNKPSYPICLDAFITYNADQNCYHVVEQQDADADTDKIFIPAEEIWHSPNWITVPNAIRQLRAERRYDGKGSKSFHNAYNAFSAILRERGIRYTKDMVKHLIRLGEFNANSDELRMDVNSRRIATSVLEPITLHLTRDGVIAGDSDQLSIRLQYSNPYHTHRLANLLGV